MDNRFAVTVQPPLCFAIPGAWIPAIPAYIPGWGLNGYDSLAPEGPWHHFAAFTCVILFLYWGLTGTFRRAFSSEPDSIRGAVRYRAALVLLASGLFLVLGYLYILFVDSLGSAAFTAWQQNMIVATSFLVPIGCLLVGLALKGYRKIALVLLLAGCGMLLLVTVTFLAYILF